MAEIVAAVASGAGLVSLAIQLLESSQKLKGLYNSSKNAPTTVSDLCFELETLSLQLRQLESHRQHDHLDAEVLNRCIGVCAKRIARVQDVVEAMSRYMRKCATFGSVYTAFKEPEMRRLLEELEQAKSSLSLAYIAYCQSWHMRNSMNQGLALQQHHDLLALQQSQLRDIQQNISTSNALAFSQLTHSSAHDRQVHAKRVTHRRRNYQKNFRLPLPRWLTSRTWVFAVSQFHQSWTIEIHSVNRRPWESTAFDCIRKGNLAALKRALDMGQLSSWDVTQGSRYNTEFTLLKLAIQYQHFELCKYLGDTVEHFRRSDLLLDAAEALIAASHPQQFKTDVVELFAGKYDMDVDITGPATEVPCLLRFEFPLISRVVMSHQTVALDKISLQDRFNIATKFTQESPSEFLDTVGLAIGSQLASLTDSHGATVLHWAARKWATLTDAQPSERMECVNFVSELIMAGAQVSAVDKCGLSPLTYMVGITSYHPDVWPWAFYYHDYPVLVPLVRQWGSTLAESGVSIHEYIETENHALRSCKTDVDIVTFLRNRELRLTGLFLAPDRTLAMEFKLVGYITLYASTVPPGCFVEEIDLVPGVCLGSPPDDGELWQEISVRQVMSEATISNPIEDSLVENEFEMGKILFGGAQDDHGAIAAVFRRNEHRSKRERDQTSSHDRSSSTPPAARRFVQYITPALQLGLDRDLQTGLTIDCNIYVHECPFDSQWGFTATDVPSYDYEMWGTCMEGCRDRPDHAADIRDSLMSMYSPNSWG